MTKIFLVMREYKNGYTATPYPINWFKTEAEAEAWIERWCNKKVAWYTIEELESTEGP